MYLSIRYGLDKMCERESFLSFLPFTRFYLFTRIEQNDISISSDLYPVTRKEKEKLQEEKSGVYENSTQQSVKTKESRYRGPRPRAHDIR